MNAGAPAEQGTDSRSLRFHRVTKTYGSFRAVSELDLEVKGGEFLTVLGPSGSGKTTVLSMIAGFQEPTSGAVFLGDRRLDTLPPEKRNIGMVFQNYALFPHMTVADNVGFPLRMRGVGRTESAARIEQALHLVKMVGSEGKFPSQLSGGQQQRVALARALVFEPPVLLMDEPLGALDRRLREAVQFELVRLHSEIAATIVYVTHDQDEALTMSDRIAIMNSGKIEQIGTPREIYREPVNEFVAKFMGESLDFRGDVTERFGDAQYRVRLSTGEVVEGHSRKNLEPGRAVLVVVRPERISIGISDSQDSVKARVSEVLYMGQRTRFTLECEGETKQHLVQENSVNKAVVSVGDAVSLRWASVDAVLLA